MMKAIVRDGDMSVCSVNARTRRGGDVIQVYVSKSQKAGTWREMSVGGHVEVMGIRYGRYVKKHGYVGTRGLMAGKTGM